MITLQLWHLTDLTESIPLMNNLQSGVAIANGNNRQNMSDLARRCWGKVNMYGRRHVLVGQWHCTPNEVELINIEQRGPACLKRGDY